MLDVWVALRADGALGAVDVGQMAFTVRARNPDVAPTELPLLLFFWNAMPSAPASAPTNTHDSTPAPAVFI